MASKIREQLAIGKAIDLSMGPVEGQRRLPDSGRPVHGGDRQPVQLSCDPVESRKLSASPDEPARSRRQLRRTCQGCFRLALAWTWNQCHQLATGLERVVTSLCQLRGRSASAMFDVGEVSSAVVSASSQFRQ
jgi:hypothetical protein